MDESEWKKKKKNEISSEAKAENVCIDWTSFGMQIMNTPRDFLSSFCFLPSRPPFGWFVFATALVFDFLLAFIFVAFCENENIANNWAYLSYTGTICGHSITHAPACIKVRDSIPRAWKSVWIIFESLDCRSSFRFFIFIFWSSGMASHAQFHNQKWKYSRFRDKEIRLQCGRVICTAGTTGLSFVRHKNFHKQLHPMHGHILCAQNRCCKLWVLRIYFDTHSRRCLVYFAYTDNCVTCGPTTPSNWTIYWFCVLAEKVGRFAGCVYLAAQHPTMRTCNTSHCIRVQCSCERRMHLAWQHRCYSRTTKWP